MAGLRGTSADASRPYRLSTKYPPWFRQFFARHIELKPTQTLARALEEYVRRHHPEDATLIPIPQRGGS